MVCYKTATTDPPETRHFNDVLLAVGWWRVGGFNGVSLAVCWRLRQSFGGFSSPLVSLADRWWLQLRIAGGQLLASMGPLVAATAYRLRFVGGFGSPLVASMAYRWESVGIAGGPLVASLSYRWRSVGRISVASVEGFKVVSLADCSWLHWRIAGAPLVTYRRLQRRIDGGPLVVLMAYRWRTVGGVLLADCWCISGGSLVASLACWLLQWCISGNLLVASMAYH